MEVKPLNIEEGTAPAKMDIDDHQHPETSLLNSNETNQIRITERKLKSENSEVQQKKLKGSYVVWLVLAGLSEVLGTGFLLFLGCLSTVPNLHTIGLSPFQISISFGLTVYVIIATFSHLSGGHINPIVTIAALIFKLVSLPAAGVYIISQFLGAILGYGGLMILLPQDTLYPPNSNKNETHAFCTTLPGSKVSVWQAFLAEFIASSILIYVCCAIWDKKNARDSTWVPVKIGAVVFLLAAVLGPISGCSMNPARSFVPALFTGIWQSHWIYWLGPISAAVVTPYFYKLAFEKFQQPDQAVS